MNSTPQLQELAEQEPWRQGEGLPVNALDPTWEPGPRDLLCDGEVDWEPGTRWWVCQKCGFVGMSYTQRHRAAESPITFLMDAIRFFISKRGNSQRTTHQMAFIAGTALRYAAVHPNLREYAARLVTK